MSSQGVTWWCLPSTRTVLACGPLSPGSSMNANGRSDVQFIERVVQHARASEVDAMVICLDDAVSIDLRDLDDLAVSRDLVSLDGAPRLARDVLETPARHVERLTNGHVGVSVHAFDVRLLVMRRVLDVL